MISAAHPEAKGRLIAMNLTIFNEKWQSILQNLSAAGSLELFVQNHQVGYVVFLGIEDLQRFLAAKCKEHESQIILAVAEFS